MFCCSERFFFFTVCSIQMVIVAENQIFDFFGFMYGPILANFFHILLIILGYFGALQFRTKYIIAYVIWNVLWLGWCLLVICFYMDVGVLNKDGDLLSLGTGSRSWWEVNGPGCIPDYTSPVNSSFSADPDPSRPPRPSKVDGCWLPYHQIETIQASIQLVLGGFGIIGGSLLSKLYMEEDAGSLNKNNGVRSSSYGVDLMASPGTSSTPHAQLNGYGVQPASPRPMTPRKVKRRSVQARDSGINTLSRSSQRRSARSRASQRRRSHQSPVSRLLDHQNRFLDSTLEETRSRGSGYTNPVFQQSSNSSINQSGIEEVYRPQSARSSYSNYHASRPISYLHNNQVFSNQAVAQVPINTNRSSTKRVRADLPRAGPGPGPGPSSFLAQGPPAYREGADSETAI